MAVYNISEIDRSGLPQEAVLTYVATMVPPTIYFADKDQPHQALAMAARLVDILTNKIVDMSNFRAGRMKFVKGVAVPVENSTMYPDSSSTARELSVLIVGQLYFVRSNK